MNKNAARAIVEQSYDEFSIKWVFRLEDEEGTEVYRGEDRVTKTDAMKDRDSMIRRASEWAEDKPHRVARRAVYLTRDTAKIG